MKKKTKKIQYILPTTLAHTEATILLPQLSCSGGQVTCDISIQIRAISDPHKWVRTEAYYQPRSSAPGLGWQVLSEFGQPEGIPLTQQHFPHTSFGINAAIRRPRPGNSLCPHVILFYRDSILRTHATRSHTLLVPPLAQESQWSYVYEQAPAV